MTSLFDAITVRAALREHHPFYVYVLCRPCGETIGMSRRQAGVIVATALANGIVLEADCLLPRRLKVEGIEYIIENGVGRDMVSNGMIEVHGGAVTQETLRLTADGFAYVVETFGKTTLIDAGVLTP